MKCCGSVDLSAGNTIERPGNNLRALLKSMRSLRLPAFKIRTPSQTGQQAVLVKT